jgi:uncharacterized membrane protein YfcA
VPTVLSSARAHKKQKSIDIDIFKTWSPALIAGTFLGVSLTSILSSHTLILIFASMSLITGAYMSLSKDHHKISKRPPQGLLKYILATSIGMLTTLMGIGGAIVSVPVMTAFNIPIKRAIGTAAAMGILTSSIGVIGFVITGWSRDIDLPFTFGFVNILAAGIIMPASVFMAPYGARAAHKLPHKILKLLFAILLSFISIRMFSQAGLF